MTETFVAASSALAAPPAVGDVDVEDEVKLTLAGCACSQGPRLPDELTPLEKSTLTIKAWAEDQNVSLAALEEFVRGLRLEGLVWLDFHQHWWSAWGPKSLTVTAIVAHFVDPHDVDEGVSALLAVLLCCLRFTAPTTDRNSSQPDGRLHEHCVLQQGRLIGLGDGAGSVFMARPTCHGCCRPRIRTVRGAG